MSIEQLSLLSNVVPIIPPVGPVIVTNVAARLENRTRSYVRRFFDNFFDPDTSFRTRALMDPCQRKWIVCASVSTGVAVVCGMTLVMDEITPFIFSPETSYALSPLISGVISLGALIGAGIDYQFLHAIHLTNYEQPIMDIELGQEDHAE